MAKKARKKAAQADVESYKHDQAKRKNIPTAENQKLVADEDKTVRKLRWPRNPDLDPQLVWRGKDFEADPLEVDAPPIYIQEKIKPQAIIEDLRRQSKERAKDGAPQFDFFHDFNGLPEGLEGGRDPELLPRRGQLAEPDDPRGFAPRDGLAGGAGGLKGEGAVYLYGPAIRDPIQLELAAVDKEHDGKRN
jgi:hypothetical protein